MGEFQSPEEAQLHVPEVEGRGHGVVGGMDLKEYFREVEVQGPGAVRQA